MQAREISHSSSEMVLDRVKANGWWNSLVGGTAHMKEVGFNSCSSINQNLISVSAHWKFFKYG